MEKMWKRIKENKTKTILFLLIAIIVIIGFIYCGISKTGKQIIIAEKREAKATQTTVVPDGYTGIYNANDLANVQNNLSGNYILMADIDMTGKTHTIIGQTSSTPFTGTFDGNFHKISNLSIESANQYVGLFGYINGGTVKNLTLENETVKGTYAINSNIYAYIGGLVGHNETGTIEGVRITGTSQIEDASTSNIYVGGLIGYQNAGTVKNSYVEGELVTPVKAKYGYIGGLIGYTNSSAIIEGNSNKINIVNKLTGTTYVGGLIGISIGNSSLVGPTISKNHSRVNIDGSASGPTSVGGLIGYANNKNIIEESYAIGSIKVGNNQANAGGLIGYIYASANINNTYADVEITGTGNNNSTIGGLVGYIYSSANINNTYAIGKIDVTNGIKGGLVGRTASGRITSSYWSPETIGISLATSTVAGEARQIQEMLYEGNYTDWDFSGIWKIEANGKSLPYLLDKKEAEVLEENIEYEEYTGKGTEDNPFLIYTIGQLQNIGSTTGTSYYKIMNNIDAGTFGNFEPIGTNTMPFKGTLDGNGNKVSNVNIESANQYVGLFGYINGGTVKNLTLENETVKGTYAINSNIYAYIGGLVGHNETGTIEGIRITGTSKIEDASTSNIYVGGLIGYQNAGTVKNSYVEGELVTPVKAKYGYIGGLIGYTNSSAIIEGNSNKINIVNKLTGTTYVGGLIGISVGNSSLVGPTISKNHSRVNIDGSASGTTYVGGLIGYANNKNIIEESYAIGSIKVGNNQANAGGLIGYIYASANINNTYADIEITGTGNNNSVIGGLVGYIYSSANINNTYAIGKIDVTTSLSKGGLVGRTASGRITSSYWSPETTGISLVTSTVAGEARQIQEMLYEGNYTDWDFSNVWKIEANGKSLPYLLEKKEAEVLEENIEYETYEGEGTEGNPFLIYTIGQLQNIGSTSYYKIMNDIDAGTFGNFEPIGTNTMPFKGTLDGNGNKVSNVNIESSNQYVGLFGYINGGTVKNLTLENETVKGTYAINSNIYAYIGGLVGHNETGTIEGVRITGTSKIEDGSTSNIYVGGLIGYQNAGTVKNSYVEGELVTPVKAKIGNIGGLIGYTNSSAIIEGNSTKINIVNKLTGATYVGGLIGISIGNSSLVGPTINKNHSRVNIDGSTSGTTYVGGLIGYTNNKNIIEESYAIGSIKVGNNQANAGGLIGYIYASANINNTYADIEIVGEGSNNSTIGGLIGYIYSSANINNTYAIGKIDVTNGIKGGLVGRTASGIITSSYWSPETTGISLVTSTVAGETRLIQEMLYETNYTDWDFSNVWKIEANGKSLPYLLDKKEPEILEENIEYTKYYEGAGTKDNPFLIYTMEELQNIRLINSMGTYYYKIMNDIDASIFGNFEPIGTNTNPFIGILDGNEHTISNLSIESSNQHVGLFGYIDGGKVEHLNLNNLSLNSTYAGTNSYIGGITGYNNGKINNVKINGNVKNSGNVTNLYIGKIAGYNNENIERVNSAGSIENIGTVTNGYIGGIAGFNNKIVKLSHNSGKIITNNINNLKVGGIAGSSSKGIAFSYSKGTMQINATTVTVGGIAGENKGRISNTYSIDNIEKNATTINSGGIAGNNTGTIEKSYWNIAGIEEQEGKGILKTLAELKQQNTYENWNFEKIWSIKENEDTPILREGKYYYDDDYWEWHTRITTSDQAYNGNHIEILDSIKFYGYGIPSYKDFLYKDYSNAGEKTFSFILDETKASYHTLDGAGFIFNAKQEDGKMSGYILLVQQKTINLYRIDDVDIATFEITTGKTVASYAGAPIASVSKKSSTIHKFIVKTSPTNITVVDNDEEVLNVDLDYSKHSGENFGLISSYVDHNCSILTEIEFSEFDLEIKDYSIPVLKVDEDDNPLQGAKIQVKDEAGNIVREGITEVDGIFKIIGLPEGIYTVEEIEAPEKYALKPNRITFKITSDGKAVDVNTGEEITLKIENELLKIDLKKYKTDTTIPVPGAIIGLFDKDGNILRDESENQITAVSDKDGNIVFKNIEAGTYKYKELEAPSGYIKDDKMYTCTLNNNGSVIFNDGENGIIYNKPIVSGEIIIKKHETGTATGVAGAIIGLYNESGDELLDSENHHIQLRTDEKGEISISSLEPGIYQYKELQAPAGYKLNGTMYKFRVNPDGTITYLENEDPEGTGKTGKDGIIYNDRVRVDHVFIIKYKRYTTEPLEGAVIGLFDNEGNPILDEDDEPIRKTTGANGQVDFEGLTPGTYQYQEISAPTGYIRNDTMYKFTIDDIGNVTFEHGTEGIIYNDRIKAGSVVIIKYESGTIKPVEGAIIGLYDEDGIAIKNAEGENITKRTNEKGQIEFTGLEPGTYQYKEIEAPAGYVLNTKMYKFIIDETGKVTFIENEDASATEGTGKDGVIYNEKVKSDDIIITKRKAGTDKPLEGAIIGLFDKDGNELKGKDGKPIVKTTDKDGHVCFEGLTPGIYQYKEIEAPEGYKLNDTMYKFTVDENGNIAFENDTDGIIYNDEDIPGEITVIIKKLETGTNKPIEGAVIGLFDEEGRAILDDDNEQIKLTTGKDGQVRFTDLLPGIYQYKELEAPTGYTLNDTMYKFEVKRDGTVVYLENEDTEGTGKTGKDGIIYNDKIETEDVIIIKYEKGTETPVAGAVIALFDSEGNSILGEDGQPIRKTTGENGKVEFTGLEPGIYKYQEVKAPEGYVINSTIYRFEIDDTGKVIYLGSDDTEESTGKDGIIYNDRIKAGSVVIIKYESGTTKPVEGAVIGLFNSEGEPIKGEDGNQIKLTTGSNGQVEFTDLLPGTYQYKELEAPVGYILNDAMCKFIVNEDGTVSFIEGEGGAGRDGIIYNGRVTADKVIITKCETGTTTGVSGAVIGLFNSEGVEILGLDGEQVKQITGRDGRIEFNNLKPGIYQYKELEAPVGYVLNNTMYKFRVNEDGTVTYLENETADETGGTGKDGIIYNDKKTLDVIVIIKYRTGTTEPVPGAVIGLFDKDGNELRTEDGEQIKLTTNGEGKIAFKLLPGTYQYKELEAPEGYVLNNTMYKFVVDEDGKVIFESGNILYNDKISTGEVIIVKYEKGTTKPLSGAVIGLFDKDGKAIKDKDGNQIKLTTNEEGKVTFKNLPEGEYKYKELKAPTGYVLNNTMYTFVVDSEGKVTFKDDAKGIIYNTKEKPDPGNVTPPENTTPPVNVTPPENTTPPGNVTPPENTTPPANVTPPGNTTPPDNTTPSNNTTPSDNSTNSSENAKKNTTENNKKNSIIENIKQGILPKTGTGRLLLVIIGTLISSAGYYAIKYKKTK